jgi:hypothetical protein
MRTEDLVSGLAQDAGPAPNPATTLAAGIVPGAAISLTLMLAILGLRPDMATAVATPMFWMKLAYALALAAVAAPLVLELARPTGRVTRLAYLFLAPVAVFVLMAIYRVANAAPDARLQLFMGSSAAVCSSRIVLLSLPILVGALISLRRLAPTRLESTGAVAGILAGAAGTFVYALHCAESASPFVVVWYTIGMAATAIVGAIVGRLALRW